MGTNTDKHIERAFSMYVRHKALGNKAQELEWHAEWIRLCNKKIQESEVNGEDYVPTADEIAIAEDGSDW